MILYLNIAVAVATLFLMGAFLVGTIGHITPSAIRREEGKVTPGTLMRIGVLAFHIKGFARIAWWDLFRPVYGLATLGEYPRSVSASLFNIGFCLMAAIGSLFILAAFYRNIPKDKRGNYTLLTAPWYPGPSPFFRSKGQDDADA
jgi:hypothetical protein